MWLRTSLCVLCESVWRMCIPWLTCCAGVCMDALTVWLHVYVWACMCSGEGLSSIRRSTIRAKLAMAAWLIIKLKVYSKSHSASFPILSLPYAYSNYGSEEEEEKVSEWLLLHCVCVIKSMRACVYNYFSFHVSPEFCPYNWGSNQSAGY